MGVFLFFSWRIDWHAIQKIEQLLPIKHQLTNFVSNPISILGHDIRKYQLLATSRSVGVFLSNGVEVEPPI